jgi:leader peptidase (prepilin peptidase)/N-methyltransferase
MDAPPAIIPEPDRHGNDGPPEPTAPSARARWVVLLALLTLATLATLALRASGMDAPRPVVASLILASALALLSAVDLASFRLPDVGTLGLCGLGLALWLPPLAGPGVAVPGMVLIHAGAALAGYALLAGLAAAWRAARGQEGLGLGDAKLLAAAGAWVGPTGLPLVLMLGAASGLATALAVRAITGQAPRVIAFGPHLALGFWVAWMTRLPQF